MHAAPLRAPGASKAASNCSRGTASRAFAPFSGSKQSNSLHRSMATSTAAAAAAAGAAASTAQCGSHDFAAVSSGSLVQQLLQLPFPPFAPLIGNEAGSFAEETITTRLPAIMDTVLADLKAEAAAVAAAAGGSQPSPDLFQQQLAAAAAGVTAMQQEMPVDGPLLPLQVPATLPAGHPLHDIIPLTNAAVAAWQQHTARQQQQQGGGSSSAGGGGAAAAAAATWLQLPWLLVECYLYVRLATILAEQPLLVESAYDPFFRQKSGALTKSLAAAADIAAAAADLLKQQQSAVAAAGCGGQQQLTALFSDDSKTRLLQVIQYALWGNKTDLSMLVDVAHLDAAAMAASSSSGSGGSSNIIVDEFEALWQHMKTQAFQQQQQQQQQGGSPSGGSSSSKGLTAALPRIDVILDNAGLELYTDLWLADYLVSAGFCSEVVLHGKTLPWFVSDTLTRDLDHLLEVCGGGGGGEGGGGGGEKSIVITGAITTAAKRWRGHLEAGVWRFEADKFWTTPFPFCWMQALAPALHADLASSSLLIFKGDLNYRKLAHDCRWPPVTPFSSALQGFHPTALLSLRTLKADVIAGLAEGEAEQLDQLDPRWQVNGKFGVVQFN